MSNVKSTNNNKFKEYNENTNVKNKEIYLYFVTIIMDIPFFWYSYIFIPVFSDKILNVSKPSLKGGTFLLLYIWKITPPRGHTSPHLQLVFSSLIITK